MTKRMAIVFAVACVSVAAFADVVVDQPYDGSSIGRTSQEFPDYPEYSLFELDDFTTTQEWQLGMLTIPGTDAGDPSTNIDVVAEIWDGLPQEPGCGTNGQTVLVAHGSEDASAVLTFDFGGQTLPGGNYWLRVYVVRDFGDHGLWKWYSTNPVTNEEAHYYNPGDGWGLGWCPIPGWEYYGESRDMVFLLEGSSGGGGCIGDLNGDGETGHADLGILLSDWGCTGSCTADLDGDGSVGHSDLGILLSDWGCVG